MRKHLLLFLLLPIVLATNCKKKNVSELDKLPGHTQAGANTMGCLVNGKAWLPDTRDNGGIPQLKAITISFWNSNTEVFCRFRRQRGSDNQGLYIYIKDFAGSGTYSMNKTSRLIGLPGSSGPLNSHFDFFDDNARKGYTTNENYTGTINITYYNAATRIIAGTFQFTGQNYQGISDSIVVTEGRFDCKME